MYPTQQTTPGMAVACRADWLYARAVEPRPSLVATALLTSSAASPTLSDTRTAPPAIPPATEMTVRVRCSAAAAAEQRASFTRCSISNSPAAPCAPQRRGPVESQRPTRPCNARRSTAITQPFQAAQGGAVGRGCRGGRRGTMCVALLRRRPRLTPAPPLLAVGGWTTRVPIRVPSSAPGRCQMPVPESHSECPG
jgi:hypothetical protein